MSRQRPHVEGCRCFGCKVGSLGFQALRTRSADPIKTTPVVLDEGPRRGKVGGTKTEHWDGRQDAKVFAPTIKISSTEE